MKNILFFLFLFSSYVISQEFQITYNNNINIHPIVDPFTNEIYYLEDWTGNIMKIRPDGSGNTLTMFPSLPTFSKREHKAFYLEFIPTIRTNIIQYDFNTQDTTHLSTHTNLPVNNLYLSPTEEKLLLKGSAPVYFSFIDSIVHDPGIRINAEKIEWINDSTLIFIDSNREQILKYSYHDNITDTLITTNIIEGIVDIACNPDSNTFTYSYFFNNGDDIGINLFRFLNQVDTIVFNFNQDDPQLAGLIILLNDLEWSPQFNKLAFIGNVLSPPVGEIYIFDTDTTIRITDFGVTDEGTKNNLVWLNADTILYDCKKTMQLSQIFGFDVKTPLFISQKSTIYDGKYFLLRNYPNPFNSQTTIKFSLPERDRVLLTIYNTLGQTVKTFDLGYLNSGEHHIIWNGQNNLGNQVASGIYIYELKTSKYHKTKKMLLIQ